MRRLLPLVCTLAVCSTASAQDLDFASFEARNGVSFEYVVLTPPGFDATEAHPILFAFPPGDMDREAVRWAAENIWGPAEQRRNWIIVIPTIPEDSWHTHPAHHALEEFLDGLKSRYRHEGLGLHVTGYAAGARAAITYTSMSSKYWSSLTVAGPSPWLRWDDSSIRRWPTNNKHIPIRILVGEFDTDGREAVERIERPFREGGVTLTTRVVKGYGEGLESILKGEMLVEVSRVAGVSDPDSD